MHTIGLKLLVSQMAVPRSYPTEASVLDSTKCVHLQIHSGAKVENQELRRLVFGLTTRSKSLPSTLTSAIQNLWTFTRRVLSAKTTRAGVKTLGVRHQLHHPPQQAQESVLAMMDDATARAEGRHATRLHKIANGLVAVAVTPVLRSQAPTMAGTARIMTKVPALLIRTASGRWQSRSSFSNIGMQHWEPKLWNAMLEYNNGSEIVSHAVSDTAHTNICRSVF